MSIGTISKKKFIFPSVSILFIGQLPLRFSKSIAGEPRSGRTFSACCLWSFSFRIAVHWKALLIGHQLMRQFGHALHPSTPFRPIEVNWKNKTNFEYAIRPKYFDWMKCPLPAYTHTATGSLSTPNYSSCNLGGGYRSSQLNGLRFGSTFICLLLLLFLVYPLLWRLVSLFSLGRFSFGRVLSRKNVFFLFV